MKQTGITPNFYIQEQIKIIKYIKKTYQSVFNKI